MIEMKHITKTYGDLTVFSDFSLEIPEGEVLCLMGKSGRGKTTLLRMLMGLEQPDAGCITGLEGKKISVTLEKGNGTFGRLYLVGTNEETGKEYLMTLGVKGTDGEFKSGALEKQIKGMELAAFTQDGSMNYELRPAALDYPDSTNDNLVIQKGVHYTGYLTYGIELADIQ